MPDIVTSKTFVDGEKGITAAKMNQIISGSVIQPSFYNSKASSPTLDPTDVLLELKGTGAYAQITGSQLVSSVSSQVDATPQIYSVRLRSFNAVGNPNFSVDQRLVGAGLTLTSSQTFVQDRWQGANNLATGRVTAVPTYGNVALPGTSFYITDRFLRMTLTTAQASLAAGELIYFQQTVEGPRLRPLLGDVHSISLLVRSSVAGLKFGVALRDVAATRSLCKLCTIPTSGVWTLIPLPNLPLWDAGATWNVQPGNQGYYFSFALAAGTTFVAPAADTFQTGNFVAPPGISNFAASAVNSTFDIAYIGHEPGAVCTTPMDCPFGQNLDGDMGCMRYFQKSYEYGTPLGSVTGNGAMAMVQLNTTLMEGPRFIKSMAKTPVGLTIYNHSNGAANSFSHLNGTNYGVTGNFGVSEKGVQAIQAATMPAPVAGAIGYMHYTADTGW